MDVGACGSLGRLARCAPSIGGTGVGRRWRTEQINWALVLRLAAEFQGFVRDLYWAGVEVFVSNTARGDPRLSGILESLLTRNLKIDRGNATREAIEDAFDRLGLDWWRDLERRDKRTRQRLEQLERLNRARNAIAHAQPSALEDLRDEGYPLTLATVMTWRQALNALTVSMDGELADHFRRLFGLPRPW